MNHYPRHVGDITRDTFGLSLTEFGAYDRLLDAYYATEKPLPLLASERYRLAGAISKPDRAAVDYIVTRYFIEEPDGWHQKRADAEIAMYRVRADTARKNGANGGRRPNPEITQSVNSGIPKPNPEKPKGQANPEPVTSNQEPKSKPGAAQGLPTYQEGLPKNLTRATWSDWKSHLAAKGKGITPQQERLQLARMAEHVDPEAIVRKAIESGHRNLEPVGGWPDAKKPTKSDLVQAVNAEIFKGVANDRPDERAIDGESQRLA